MKTENITCPCGTTFQWQNENTDEFWTRISRPEHCATCQEIHNREAEALREKEQQAMAAAYREQLAARIDEATPPRYRATDTGHPDFNRKLWQQIKAWLPTDEMPFLGLVGPSGACKTRCAFLKQKSMVLAAAADSGKAASWEWVTAGEFGETVLNQFRKNNSPRDLHDRDPQATASSNLRNLRRCDILLFDDLGKGRATPAVTEELFHLIDHRHANNLPTIWTANSRPEAIVTGMPEDVAGPLAGRLIECSKIVVVQ